MPVDGSGNGYFKTVCDYVHLNPVRAKMLGDEQFLSDYCWSSYPAYLQEHKSRPSWLRVDRLFGEWRIRRDNAVGRQEFAAQMEARRGEDNAEQWKPIRRGWCFGGEEFREELLERMQGLGREHHQRKELNESATQRGERIIAEELKKNGWTQAGLAEASKGDERKVRIAMRLRRETTLSLKEIAAALQMGAWGYLARLLHEAKNCSK